MNITLFVLSCIALLSGSLIQTLLLCSKQDKNLTKLFLITSVLCMVEVLVIELVLGFIIQKLNIYTVTISHFIILGVTLILMYLFRKQFKETIKNHMAKKVKENKRKIEFIDIVNVLLTILVVLIMGFKLVYNFNTMENSADGRNYHTPNLIDYIQQEKIYDSEKYIWSNTYPKNTEMLNMWTIIFDRSLHILRMPQVLIGIVGAVAVYGILRKLNVSSKLSLFGSYIYLLSPVVLLQMTTTYIDSSLVSMFMVSIYLALELLDHTRKSDLLCLGLSLAFFMGIKSSAIAYSVIILVFLLVYYVVKKRPLKDIITSCLIIGAVLLSVGGVWYYKNLINYNNPIYPFKMLWFEGMDMKTSIMDTNEPNSIKEMNSLGKVMYSWYSTPNPGIGDDERPIRERIFKQYSDSRLGGMGIIWSVILFPSMVLMFIYIVYKIIKDRGFKIIDYRILFITAVILISFLITPSSWWARYTFFIELIGIIALVKLVYILKDKKILAGIIIAGSSLMLCATSMQGIASEVPAYKYIQNTKGSDKLRNLLNQDKELKVFVWDEGPSTDLLKLYGNNTQNQVVLYLFNNNEVYKKYMKNYGISSSEERDRLIEAHKPNYIVAYKDQEELQEKKNLNVVLKDIEYTVFEVK